MGYIDTGMGDSFSALLVSLMALQLMLVDRNPFRPYLLLFLQNRDVKQLTREIFGLDSFCEVRFHLASFLDILQKSLNLIHLCRFA